MGNENKAENKTEELGGRAKEAVGNATGDEALDEVFGELERRMSATALEQKRRKTASR